MPIESLIPIIVVILAVVIGWAIFKKITKIIFIIGIVLLLIIGGTTYFIYKDISDLKQNFSDSTKKMLLVDGNKVITGFLMNKDVSFLSDNELNELSSYLGNNDYEKMLGDSYKLMAFQIDIVLELDAEEIEIDDKAISKQDLISVFKSDNAADALKDKGITLSDYEDDEVKAALFGIVLTENVLSPDNPLLLFSEFKNGNIIIYRETALFKAAKIIPLAFIEQTAKNLFGKAKEKVKSVADEAIA